MNKIAIIGTGIMGHGMAINYLKKGYEVYVWNRSEEKLKDLIDQGAVIAATPKEAAEKADIVFEVTANDESSRSVWYGDDGIIAGLNAYKYAIASATLSINWIDELAISVQEKGYKFFDMPLTGGRVGAETGKLTFLVGGNEDDLQKITKDLEAVGVHIHYFGQAGAGMRYKLILNSMQATHIAAFGEALKMARSMNLDVKRVGDALVERPGGVITEIAWRDYQTKPEPINFSIEWITKDLSYAHEMSEGVDTPIFDAVLDKYETAMQSGMNEEDWTAVNNPNID